MGPNPSRRDLVDLVSIAVTRLRRSAVVRRAARRRAGAVLVALVVATTVHSTVTEGERAQRVWGDSIAVLVATTDLPAGTVLDVSNTALTERPTGLVASGVLTARRDGRRTTVHVPEGEPIVAARLAGADAGPVAARLPSGSSGVSIEATAAFPTLRPGDRVDVLAPAAPGASDQYTASVGVGADAVAENALVIEVDEGAVTLAVSVLEVPATTAASMTGLISLVVVGPDDDPGTSGP